jgi:hypothetical protein
MTHEHPTGAAGFDVFFVVHGYQPGQGPEAFAAWLASRAGGPITGVAVDLSGTVHADPAATSDA